MFNLLLLLLFPNFGYFESIAGVISSGAVPMAMLFRSGVLPPIDEWMPESSGTAM
jgi:hypothetical protein